MVTREEEKNENITSRWLEKSAWFQWFHILFPL